MDEYKEPANPVGTVTELFAGVGGFRIGLARSNWKTEFSNQWEPSTKVQHASDVYVARFGAEGHSNEDIAEEVKRFLAGDISIPKTTMLVGGFPCQDYSVAKTLGSSSGLQGKKGVLWWEILKIVEINEPPILFLENVDRLLKSPSTQRGRDFAIMLASLSDLGYQVEWRIVNAADYGFPQRRKRVFIVAKRNTEFKLSPTEDDLSEVLFTSGVLPRAFAVEPAIEKAVEVQTFEISGDLAAITESFEHGTKTSPFLSAGVISGRFVTTANVTPVVEPISPLSSVLEDEETVPPEYFVPEEQEETWIWLKGSKSIPRTHKGSGVTYFYTEGSMAYPDDVNKPARTILTAEGGSTPSRFKHIIRTPSGKLRRLLPVELERLNGFPSGWTEGVTAGKTIPDTRRAFFMGNALVIGLIERVGNVLADDWSLVQQTSEANVLPE